MAIRRSNNIINQQRINTTDLKSIESAVRNDFDELLSALITGEDKSYVIRGLEIEMAGSIGASANGLQLIVANSSILHGNSSEAGTFFEIATGTANQVLSATTNTKVNGAFTPSALNYVSVEFTRQVDDSTTSQVYLWNPTTKTEITKTLPLAEVMDYQIVISSSIFSSNVLPIAVVETDASNNVLNVQDRRDMLFRSGTGGSSTPDPFNEYSWTNHTEGRSENHWSSSSSSVSPFRGGDKQIQSFKENDLAVKTELKLIKGTTYWYSPHIGGSIASLRYDLGNTVLTGRGTVTHDAGNAGLMNWSEDMFMTVLATRLKYKLEANVATTDIDLDDKQAAYIKIIRNIDVVPQIVFTNGSAICTSVGAVSWTTGLEAGDFIKVGAEEDTSYYQILSIDSVSQVTLTENFGGTSTGINGTDAKYAWGNYRTDATPSTDRHIKVANIEDMPFDADTFWLFFRDDNAGVSRIYIRFLNAELKQGEVITVADQVPAAVLAYMGSSNDVDSDPNYATLATNAKTGTENYNATQGENLTIRSSKLTSMIANKAQDKTIKFLSNHIAITNQLSGAIQNITVSGGSGSITVAIPSSANNGTISTSGIIPLLINQAAYFQIDRNASFSLAGLGSLTVANITDIPLGENVFVFAYRLSGTTIYDWNGISYEIGTHYTLPEVRSDVQQNKTAKMIKGGTWSWNLGTTTLANSALAHLQVATLADNVNDISAQSIVIDTDGKCAYVTLKRNAGASVLTVSVADIASVPQTDDIFIIARRIGNDVIVGDSLKLVDGESADLYATISDQSLTYIGATDPSDSDPSYTSSTSGSLALPNFNTVDGENLTTRLGKISSMLADLKQDLNIEFDAGTITWSSGNITITGASLSIPGTTIGAGEVLINTLGSTALADNSALYVDISRTTGTALTLASGTLASLTPNQQRLILIRNINGNLLVK